MSVDSIKKYKKGWARKAFAILFLIIRLSCYQLIFNSLNAIVQVTSDFTLPKSNNSPPLFGEKLVDFFVASDIMFNLIPPKIRVASKLFFQR